MGNSTDGNVDGSQIGPLSALSAGLAAKKNPPIGSLSGVGYQDSEDAFPFRVYSLLETTERLGFENIVSWVQGGSAFIVHERDVFTKQIMPLYFSQSKFKSFQLNFYRYGRIPSGPFKGAYAHKYFIRGNRRLCHLITRASSKSEEDGGGDTTAEAPKAGTGATGRRRRKSPGNQEKDSHDNEWGQERQTRCQYGDAGLRQRGLCEPPLAIAFEGDMTTGYGSIGNEETGHLPMVVAVGSHSRAIAQHDRTTFNQERGNYMGEEDHHQRFIQSIGQREEGYLVMKTNEAPTPPQLEYVLSLGRSGMAQGAPISGGGVILGLADHQLLYSKQSPFLLDQKPDSKNATGRDLENNHHSTSRLNIPGINMTATTSNGRTSWVHQHDAHLAEFALALVASSREEVSSTAEIRTKNSSEADVLGKLGNSSTRGSPYSAIEREIISTFKSQGGDKSSY